jgi:hypothetical protein
MPRFSRGPVKRMPEHRYLNRREQRGDVRTDKIHSENRGKAQELANRRRILIEKQNHEAEALRKRHEEEHESLDGEVEELLDDVRHHYNVDPKELIKINAEIISVIRRKAVDDPTLDRFSPEEKELIRDTVEEILVKERNSRMVSVAGIILGLAIAILGPRANRNEIVKMYDIIKARVYSSETREVREELTQQQENLVSRLTGLNVSRLHALGIGVGTILLITIMAKAMKRRINDRVIYEKLVLPEKQLEEKSYAEIEELANANNEYTPEESEDDEEQ